MVEAHILLKADSENLKPLKYIFLAFNYNCKNFDPQNNQLYCRCFA